MLPKLQNIWTNHGPVITTTAAVIGVGATVYSTTRSTIKACDLIQEAENERAWERIEWEHHGSADDPEVVVELSGREIFDLTWRLYIPPALFAMSTIGCIIAVHRVGVAQAAAATAIYNLTDTAYNEFRNKVDEKYGENESDIIREDIVKEKVHAEPKPEPGTSFVTGNGMVLCKDGVSGRYFYSSLESIRRSENEINRRLLSEGVISLSEFYNSINIPQTSISDEVGWDQDRMLDLRCTTTLSEDDQPCIFLDYDVKPLNSFHNF